MSERVKNETGQIYCIWNWVSGMMQELYEGGEVIVEKKFIPNNGTDTK